MTDDGDGAAPAVRVGLIGCGNVAAAYMALAARLAARGLAAVTVACGRPHQRRFAVEGLRVPRFTTQHEEVLADPEVDLVLVLTSMASHDGIAGAALAAGKHVLVEKPMAMSLDRAAALMDQARRSPGYLMCAPFTTLSPTFRAMGRRLARGDIGRALSARARYGWAGPDWQSWFYQAAGGALFDLGIYNVTTLTGLLGPARRVTALTGIAVPEREIRGEKVRLEIEDNAHLAIELGDGCLAAVTTGFTMQQYRGPAIEVYGTTGTMQMLGDDWDPDGYELWRGDVGAWQVFKESDPEWPWTDGLAHVVDCIRKRVPPQVTPEHAFHVLEILVKARAAARDGETKAIDSAFAPLVFEEEENGPAELVHDRARRLGSPHG